LLSFPDFLWQSDLQGAFELLNEAANIFQSVHGALSKEVAQCCKLLAVVLFHAEDFQAAIVQGHKELILNERILGLDHPDTIHR
jgi:protein TIF31